MSRKQNQTPPQPTQAELALLRVLWDRGPSTVREVWESLPEPVRPGYTTVLKLLQIMTTKGLVKRDDSRRAHVYTTHQSQDQTQKQLVGDLLDRAFRGSAAGLVMQALSTRPASKTELDEIRMLLDTLDSTDSATRTETKSDPPPEPEGQDQ